MLGRDRAQTHSSLSTEPPTYFNPPPSLLLPPSSSLLPPPGPGIPPLPPLPPQPAPRLRTGKQSFADPGSRLWQLRSLRPGLPGPAFPALKSRATPSVLAAPRGHPYRAGRSSRVSRSYPFAPRTQPEPSGDGVPGDTPHTHPPPRAEAWAQHPRAAGRISSPRTPSQNGRVPGAEQPPDNPSALSPGKAGRADLGYEVGGKDQRRKRRAGESRGLNK